MNARRNGQTGRCKRMAMALGAIAALLVLGASSSAIAKSKPVTVKLRGVPSLVKAPDGTITARVVYKAKDPACLSKIPFERGSPFFWLRFPGEAFIDSPKMFQLLPAGHAAYALTLPPETTVSVRTVSSEKQQFTTSQATSGFVAIGAFRNPNPRKDPSWQRKSKKHGRVLCAPQAERGGDFQL